MSRETRLKTLERSSAFAPREDVVLVLQSEGPPTIRLDPRGVSVMGAAGLDPRDPEALIPAGRPGRASLIDRFRRASLRVLIRDGLAGHPSPGGGTQACARHHV